MIIIQPEANKNSWIAQWKSIGPSRILRGCGGLWSWVWALSNSRSYCSNYNCSNCSNEHKLLGSSSNRIAKCPSRTQKMKAAWCKVCTYQEKSIAITIIIAMKPAPPNAHPMMASVLIDSLAFADVVVMKLRRGATVFRVMATAWPAVTSRGRVLRGGAWVKTEFELNIFSSHGRDLGVPTWHPHIVHWKIGNGKAISPQLRD